MGADVFSILARLGLDATSWRAELKSVRGEFNSFITSWVTTAVSGGALLAMSKSAVELAGSLKSASLQVGINVEKLQVLNAVARDANLPQETLQKALEKTRFFLEKARQGGEEQIKVLAKLHLTSEELASLPLEKKFERIAVAMKNSENHAVAYNAVSEIFGEKIGPKLIEVLDTLATDGFPKLAREAKANGDIMSATTIVALEKAGNAIEAFKQRATIALGNILVNFRSEEGLMLLWYKFAKVAGQFGAKIFDSVNEAMDLGLAVIKGTFRASVAYLKNLLVDLLEGFAIHFNRILPAKFQIDVGGIEKWRSAADNFSEEIGKAIADTKPSTLSAEIGKFWDERIHKQQLIVDAANRIDFGKDATKLKDAGKNIEQSVTNAANNLADAGKKAAEPLFSFVEQFKGAVFQLTRTGKNYADQSSDSLQGVRDRLQSQLSQVGPDGMAIKDATLNGNYGSWLTAQTIQGELAKVQKELDLRQQISSYASRYGESAARRQFGDTDTDRALRDVQTSSQRAAVATENVNANLDALNTHLGVPPAGRTG